MHCCPSPVSHFSVYLTICLLGIKSISVYSCCCNRNLRISRAPLKSQAQQGTDFVCVCVYVCMYNYVAPVALLRVGLNSDTVSLVVVGSASERLMP